MGDDGAWGVHVHGSAHVHAHAQQLSSGWATYVLGRLPYAMHYSWAAIAATRLRLTVAVSMGATPSSQILLALASQLGAAAFCAVEAVRWCEPAIAFVGGWALTAVARNDGKAELLLLRCFNSGSPARDELQRLKLRRLRGGAGSLGKGLVLLGCGLVVYNCLEPVWSSRKKQRSDEGADKGTKP